MPLSLNSSASASGNSVTLSTTVAPCMIYVIAYDPNAQAPVDITGVSDTAGLVWTRRADSNGNLVSFFAIANSILSSDVITLTSSFNDNFTSAFAVSGICSGFDGHSGIPSAGNSFGSAQAISTANPNDFLIGSYGSCDGAGNGWTQISLLNVGVQNFLVEYKIVSVPQSGTPVDAVNINAFSDYLIDAIVASPPIPGHGGRGGRHRRGGGIMKVIT